MRTRTLIRAAVETRSGVRFDFGRLRVSGGAGTWRRAGGPGGRSALVTRHLGSHPRLDLGWAVRLS